MGVEQAPDWGRGRPFLGSGRSSSCHPGAPPTRPSWEPWPCSVSSAAGDVLVQRFCIVGILKRRFFRLRSKCVELFYVQKIASQFFHFICFSMYLASPPPPPPQELVKLSLPESVGTKVFPQLSQRGTWGSFMYLNGWAESVFLKVCRTYSLNRAALPDPAAGARNIVFNSCSDGLRRENCIS